jgi:hypothetical protein
MPGLSTLEIMKVVDQYIGSTSGYLKDFSYRDFVSFFSDYCGLDLDVAKHEGNNREVLLYILKSSTPHEQAKILRGVLEKFPVVSNPYGIDDQFRAQRRTKERFKEIEKIAERLEKDSIISGLDLKITSTTVEEAIKDGEILIKTSGASRAVDRYHTALHGHLGLICDLTNIDRIDKESLTSLFKKIRSSHPAFQNSGLQDDKTNKVLLSMANIIDTLQPIRNHSSPAHPNDQLLEEDEAWLVIHAVKTILHYLDSKLS